MPYKESQIEKLYYSITEVAGMFKVNSSLIRFWEKQFKEIKPKKNSKGTRLFTKEDIDTFALIYHLVKEKGMTIEGARKKLKDNKDDSVNNYEIIQSLVNVKNQLLAIRENL
ncbi:MAG: MerR family transcriptional regulator [Bacteroidota bacterium]